MKNDEVIRWLSRIKADLQSMNRHSSPDELKSLDIAIAVLDHQERIKTRLAQIASGDYKACGHTAEEVAKTALAELCGERDAEANKTMGEKGGELKTWIDLLKHPEMLKCTDPDCMVERSWTIQGQTVTSKYISPEKYMQKYHPAASGKAIDHSGDSTDMVTQ